MHKAMLSCGVGKLTLNVLKPSNGRCNMAFKKFQKSTTSGYQLKLFPTEKLRHQVGKGQK